MQTPFFVPRRARYQSIGFSELGVTVTCLTETRVVGHYGNIDDSTGSNFNVKRDGNRFALGSDSGKQRFYISDAEKYAELKPVDDKQ